MISDKIRLLLLQGSALLLAACAATGVNLPAVSESSSGERFPGKIIWRDLLTNDPAASQRFYGELFGWEFEGVGIAAGLTGNSTYTLIRHNGTLIGGMVDTEAVNNRSDISQWVVLMSVSDVEEAAGRFADEGGMVITPPTDLQRRGKISVVKDAEGALLALLETKDGDPADREPEIGGFLWDELWATDIERATHFYKKAAGFDSADWDTDADAQAPANYRLLKSDNVPRAGIIANPLEDLGPVWVSYLRVNSPSAITTRVAELGGRVIVEAQARTLGGEVAFVAGPSGAGIALQTWPLD